MNDEINVEWRWSTRWWWQRRPWRASFPIASGHFLVSVDGWRRRSVVSRAERLRDAHRRRERADIDGQSFGFRR